MYIYIALRSAWYVTNTPGTSTRRLAEQVGTWNTYSTLILQVPLRKRIYTHGYGFIGSAKNTEPNHTLGCSSYFHAIEELQSYPHSSILTPQGPSQYLKIYLTSRISLTSRLVFLGRGQVQRHRLILYSEFREKTSGKLCC
jgi:hypothetical protein